MRKSTHLKLEKLSDQFGIDLTQQPFAHTLIENGLPDLLEECLGLLKDRGFLGELVNGLSEDHFLDLVEKALGFEDVPPVDVDGILEDKRIQNLIDELVD